MKLLLSIIFLSLTNSAFGTTIYQYSGTLNGSNDIINSTQSLAVKVTPGATAIAGNVDLILQNYGGAGNWSTNPVTVKLCSDNSGQPSNTCTSFTTPSSGPGPSFGTVSYAGAYSVTSGTVFWVVASSTNTGIAFQLEKATPGNDSYYSSSGTFYANGYNYGVTVSTPSAPTVTAVSPTSGSTAGGTTITITGTNLSSTTGVTVGGNACASISVISATSLTCLTPAGTAGTASILVTTAGGVNAANTLFTYSAAPAPASIPSLSEWMQLMLALMVMTVIGWHFHRERSY